jgi:hypothetical protein
LVLDQGHGYTKELTSVDVGSDGYKLLAKDKLGVNARLQLFSEENSPKDLNHSIILSSKIYEDFIVPCNMRLNLVYFKKPF